MEKKSLYQKLAEIKLELSKSNLKKSGVNKYSGFTYYELADILPAIISLCAKHGVYTYTSYNNDLATLVAINTDNALERVEVTSPMRTFELKGSNQIQVLGGIETYSRRYLYLAMFDIVESDSFDANCGSEKNVEVPKKEEQKTKEHSQITEDLILQLKSLNINEKSLCQYYGVTRIEDLTIKQGEEAIALKMKPIKNEIKEK